jgi:hypothetical protein
MTAALPGDDVPDRTPLHVDLAGGQLETGGRRMRFDPSVPDAVLVAYLRLVRKLRDVPREPSFVLRRSDVLVLAEVLRWDAVDVLDQLGDLMGATVTQRRTMVATFAAGALLIAVATSAAALAPSLRDDVAEVPVAGEVADESPTADRPAPDATRIEDREDGTDEDADAETEPGAGADEDADGSAGSRVAPTETAPRPAPAARPAPSRIPSRSAPTPVPSLEVVQPGAGIDLAGDDHVEVVQPGTGIDLPPDDDVEIVQPGADIDLPPDDPDPVDPAGSRRSTPTRSTPTRSTPTRSVPG